ncbi:unnamed protein product [Musa banksii]
MPSHNSKKVIRDDDEVEFEKMKKKIEASQENALSLCTEKVLLAQQASKIPPDETAILPPLPIVNKDEKCKGEVQRKGLGWRPGYGYRTYASSR